MNKRHITGLFLFIVSLPLVCGAGCGTARSALELSKDAAKEVSNKILPGEKAVLKKRVLISPVMNQAGVEDEKISMLTSMLEDSLAKDHLIVKSLSRGPEPSRAEMRTPQYGVVIDPDLVGKAEEMDMNVLITCILNPFEIETKKSGLWPFHRVKKEIKASISLQAIDITYGTLFFNRLETRRFKVDNDESEEEEIRQIDDEKLNKELSSMMDDLSSDLLDSLHTLPWSGHIEQAGDGLLKVDGGSDIGITVGHIFEVYGKREEIQSVDGKSYYFLGPKDGEIRVKEVNEHYCLAVPLNEKQFNEGQIVRIKR